MKKLVAVILLLSGFGLAQTWQVKSTVDRVEDTTKVSFTLVSTDRTAALHLECTKGVKFGDGRTGIERNFYISTNRFLDHDTTVQIRVDSDPAFTKTGIISSNYKAAFLEDNRIDAKLLAPKYGYESPLVYHHFPYNEFLPKMFAAKRLLVKLPIFHSTDRVWEFHPQGIDEKKLESACRISEYQPRD